MTTYLLRRLLWMIPTLIGISLVTFFVVQLAPGDPVSLRGQGLEGSQNVQNAQELAARRARYGLDRPIWERYVRWLGHMAMLDFGKSYVDQRPVLQKVAERLPVSLQLSVLSVLLAYLIAVPLGVFSAAKHGSAADRTLTLGVFILYSLPSFWVALLLILFFGGGDFLDWFPVYGLQSAQAAGWPWWQWLADRAWHLVLPVACLTYASFAGLSRYTKNAMLEALRQDYIRTAKAKGLGGFWVIVRHGLRNALIPIVTLLAFQLPALLGGSVIIESIFALPGMGQLAFEAILARDYPVILGIFTMTSFLTLLGFLIADVLYTVADPRIRYS